MKLLETEISQSPSIEIQQPIQENIQEPIQEIKENNENQQPIEIENKEDSKQTETERKKEEIRMKIKEIQEQKKSKEVEEIKEISPSIKNEEESLSSITTEEINQSDEHEEIKQYSIKDEVQLKIKEIRKQNRKNKQKNKLFETDTEENNQNNQTQKTEEEKQRELEKQQIRESRKQFRNENGEKYSQQELINLYHLKQSPPISIVEQMYSLQLKTRLHDLLLRIQKESIPVVVEHIVYHLTSENNISIFLSDVVSLLFKETISITDIISLFIQVRDNIQFNKTIELGDMILFKQLIIQISKKYHIFMKCNFEKNPKQYKKMKQLLSFITQLFLQNILDEQLPIIILNDLSINFEDTRKLLLYCEFATSIYEKVKQLSMTSEYYNDMMEMYWRSSQLLLLSLSQNEKTKLENVYGLCKSLLSSQV